VRTRHLALDLPSKWDGHTHEVLWDDKHVMATRKGPQGGRFSLAPMTPDQADELALALIRAAQASRATAAQGRAA